jgi:hypothetical protein
MPLGALPEEVLVNLTGSTEVLDLFEARVGTGLENIA